MSLYENTDFKDSPVFGEQTTVIAVDSRMALNKRLLLP